MEIIKKKSEQLDRYKGRHDLSSIVRTINREVVMFRLC